MEIIDITNDPTELVRQCMRSACTAQRSGAHEVICVEHVVELTISLVIQDGSCSAGKE